MSEKGIADDAVSLHQVYPFGRVKVVQVAQPYRLPLVTPERPPAAFAIGALEAETARDDRMAEGAAPRGQSSAITQRSYLDYMQGHGRVQHGHIADGEPRVDGPCLCVGVPGVYGDPAMQCARVVGEG